MNIWRWIVDTFIILCHPKLDNDVWDLMEEDWDYLKDTKDAPEHKRPPDCP